MDYPLLLMSFSVGLLIGLTSMGGATLMGPLLVLVVGVRPVIAVGCNLAYGAVTKIVGAGMHWRQGGVDFTMVRRLALGSIPGGLAGSFLVTRIARHGIQADDQVRRAMGIVLVLVAINMLVLIVRGSKEMGNTRHLEFLRGRGAVLLGALVGFCVGLTSVGSGSLIAPYLMLIYPNTPARVVGTDLMHAALLVTATGLIHSASGNVDWSLVASLLTGSVPGVLLGSFLAPRLPARLLRLGLAVVLLGTGVKLI